MRVRLLNVNKPTQLCGRRGANTPLARERWCCGIQAADVRPEMTATTARGCTVIRITPARPLLAARCGSAAYRPPLRVASRPNAIPANSLMRLSSTPNAPAIALLFKRGHRMPRLTSFEKSKRHLRCSILIPHRAAPRLFGVLGKLGKKPANPENGASHSRSCAIPPL